MDLHILSSKNAEELMEKLADGEARKSFTHSKMSIVIDGSTLTIVLED